MFFEFLCLIQKLVSHLKIDLLLKPPTWIFYSLYLCNLKWDIVCAVNLGIKHIMWWYVFPWRDNFNWGIKHWSSDLKFPNLDIEIKRYKINNIHSKVLISKGVIFWFLKFWLLKIHKLWHQRSCINIGIRKLRI